MPVRTFTGLRPRPPAEYQDRGITNAGTAPDYEGAVFSDGTVAVRWLTEHRSHSIWASWDDFYLVHGHPEYGTVVTFTDGGQPPGAARVWCPACRVITTTRTEAGVWRCGTCFYPLAA